MSKEEEPAKKKNWIGGPQSASPPPAMPCVAAEIIHGRQFQVRSACEMAWHEDEDHVQGQVILSFSDGLVNCCEKCHKAYVERNTIDPVFLI